MKINGQESIRFNEISCRLTGIFYDLFLNSFPHAKRENEGRSRPYIINVTVHLALGAGSKPAPWWLTCCNSTPMNEKCSKPNSVLRDVARKVP
jgi:hypothetical protein